MNMKEFERQNNNNIEEIALPEDFSEEDVAFAQELGVLFSPEEEIIPPYFAQTLLEVEDPRYTPVEAAFAQKTSARVFRSLKLRRSLFSHRNSKLSMVGDALHEIASRKTLLAWAAKRKKIKKKKYEKRRK